MPLTPDTYPARIGNRIPSSDRIPYKRKALFVWQFPGFPGPDPIIDIVQTEAERIGDLQQSYQDRARQEILTRSTHEIFMLPTVEVDRVSEFSSHQIQTIQLEEAPPKQLPPR